MHHPILVGCLLGAAVALAAASTLGMMIMRDPYQRLHFPAVVVLFSSLLIVVAVWVDEPDPQARIKVVLIAVVLFFMNSVLTSATAKAIRVQQAGRWAPRSAEKMALAQSDQIAGTDAAPEEDQA